MNSRRTSRPSSHLGGADMSDNETRDGSNPSSKLLQDLLRERKAQSRQSLQSQNPDSRKGGRRRNSFDVREVQSSPVAPAASRDVSGRHSRRSSNFARSEILSPKEWGMREIDEVSYHRTDPKCISANMNISKSTN